MKFSDYLVVALGGAMGAIFRAFIFTFFRGIPITPTLIVNVLAGFLVGFGSGFFDKFGANLALRLFFITGFLGALSTFSMLTYENVYFIEHKEYIKFLFNSLSNLILCIISCYTGMWIFQKIF